MAVVDADEIPTLVAIAMNSAKDDMDVMKVTSLHAAITGYAPLLFDLPAESGYRELMDKCNSVWESQEQLDELPSKLVNCITYHSGLSRYVSALTLVICLAVTVGSSRVKQI